MRHRVATSHFNRDANHRKALLKNLLRGLVEHGEVTTTVEKAKEIKRLADKVIHRAQEDTVNMRRVLHRTFGRRDVVNTLFERIAPAMKDRTSGFTTLSIVGARRGDNARMAKLELMVKPEQLHTLKSGQVFEAKPKAAKPAKAKSEKKAVEKPVAKAVKAAAPKKAAAKPTAAKKPKKAATAK
jgi:large subunit ribosomal protein L17